MSGHGAFASHHLPGTGSRAHEENVMPTAGVLEGALSMPSSRSGAANVHDVLALLSLTGRESTEVDARLAEVAALPFVTSVLGLPDRHQKGKMEVPSSIGIATRGVLVPEFTSVAVNDGMGVVVTDLHAKDLTPERLQALFARIGSHSAGNVFERNRYSLGSADVRRALVHGGRAVTSRYDLDPAAADRMENGGRIELPGDPEQLIREVVPGALLNGRLVASEMGLNFGGNHFLEVQVVDEIRDANCAARWGLKHGQVVVMYHLGPGPFSGTLLHHWSMRTKLDSRRAPAFFLSKLGFHYGQRLGRGSLAAKWATHFRRNGWTAIREESAEGRGFIAAMAMAMNFGYAYRLATVRAILDGLREAISPNVRGELLCDISHNGITEESLGGERSWVARHNACRLVPGQPTLVAGAWDVSSWLGLGLSDSHGSMHSYDHGAGHLIETARAEGRLSPTEDTVTRVRMTRGRKARVVSARNVTVMQPGPIDALMERLADHHLMRPAVRLRPLGNLKN
jgi:RNA-splicing ligase RtcB